jgi:hypothetical protein
MERMPSLRSVLLLCLLLSPPTRALSVLAHRLTDRIQSTPGLGPLARTILCVPADDCAEDLVFVQKATNSRIQGLANIQRACLSFDADFQSPQDEGGVTAALHRVSLLSKDNIRVQWNVTWVPDTAAWLTRLPAREKHYIVYNHLSSQVSTFSWKAVGDLVSTWLTTGRLRIPLACIQGLTDLRFDENQKLVLIEEDLVYAMDLQRGALQNRKCADDLRLFLESGRRLDSIDADDWYDRVATALAWSSVPGSGPLDMDETVEGPTAALIFVGVAFGSVLCLASLLAPELLGQSLWGSPHLLVPQVDDWALLYE